MSTMELSSAGRWIGLRRLLFKIHLWIGITLCIPFALLGITGSFLVFDQDVLAPPKVATAGTMAAPQAMFDAAAKAFPGYRVTALTMPVSAGDPATVRIVQNGELQGAARLGEQVYLDPVTLAVVGSAPVRTSLVNWMHQLHGSLALGGATGRPLVGWLGVGMTILGLTGLYMWWPKGNWRMAFGIPKGAKGVLWHRQLHASAGILGWVVFVAVSFTGVAISFPYVFGPGFAGAFGGSPAPRPAAIEAVPDAVPIDANKAVEVALGAVANAHLTSVNLPARANQPYRITMTAEGAMAGSPAIQVLVDPYRAETTSVRDPRTFALGDWLMAWQRTIHDGRAFGTLWAVLVFLIGFFPPLFAVTGTTMWWLRRRNRAALRARDDLAPEGVPAE